MAQHAAPIVGSFFFPFGLNAFWNEASRPRVVFRPVMTQVIFRLGSALLCQLKGRFFYRSILAYAPKCLAHTAIQQKDGFNKPRGLFSIRCSSQWKIIYWFVLFILGNNKIHVNGRSKKHDWKERKPRWLPHKEEREREWERERKHNRWEGDKQTCWWATREGVKTRGREKKRETLRSPVTGCKVLTLLFFIQSNCVI